MFRSLRTFDARSGGFRTWLIRLTRNLLGMEVSAAHVASVVAELCSDRFVATTGAQVPIDGGSERTI